MAYIEAPAQIQATVDYVLDPSGSNPQFMSTHHSVLRAALSSPEAALTTQDIITNRLHGEITSSLDLTAETERRTEARKRLAIALSDPILSPFAVESITGFDPEATHASPEAQLLGYWSIIHVARELDPTVILPQPLADFVMNLALHPQAADNPDRDRIIGSLMEMSELQTPPDITAIPAQEAIDEKESQEIRLLATASSDEQLEISQATLIAHADFAAQQILVRRDQYFGSIRQSSEPSASYFETGLIVMLARQPEVLNEAIKAGNFKSRLGLSAARLQYEFDLLEAHHGDQDALLRDKDLGQIQTALGNRALQMQIEIGILQQRIGNPTGLMIDLQKTGKDEVFETEFGRQAAWVQHDHDLLALAMDNVFLLYEYIISVGTVRFHTPSMAAAAKEHHDALLLDTYRNEPERIKNYLDSQRFFTDSGRQTAQTYLDTLSASDHST